jgi:hypothetical protein
MIILLAAIEAGDYMHNVQTVYGSLGRRLRDFS